LNALAAQVRAVPVPWSKGRAGGFNQGHDLCTFSRGQLALRHAARTAAAACVASAAGVIAGRVKVTGVSCRSGAMRAGQAALPPSSSGGSFVQPDPR
jgi:hypothetical protein